MSGLHTTVEQMDSIGKLLDGAMEYGLEVEVIFYALEAMKQDPTLQPVEAFLLGVSEWIK